MIILISAFWHELVFWGYFWVYDLSWKSGTCKGRLWHSCFPFLTEHLRWVLLIWKHSDLENEILPEPRRKLNVQNTLRRRPVTYTCILFMAGGWIFIYPISQRRNRQVKRRDDYPEQEIIRELDNLSIIYALNRFECHVILKYYQFYVLWISD